MGKITMAIDGAILVFNDKGDIIAVEVDGEPIECPWGM